MSHRFNRSSLAMVGLLSAAALLASCSRGNTNSAATSGPADAQSSPAASPKSAFETDLEYVRKGQYTYVWIFSRKDGKTIDKTDADYLRKTAPQVVDWVTTEEGRKVIAGTNFNLEQGNLGLLKKRFNVEDYTGR